MSTPYEVIARLVEERFRQEFESRVQTVIDGGQAAIEQAVAASTANLEDAIAGAVLDSHLGGDIVVPDTKADAKSRSWRTLVQGLIATVIVGVGGTVGTAVVDPNFELDDLSDWKGVAIAGGTAAVAALVAYVQRFVQPPKVQ